MCGIAGIVGSQNGAAILNRMQPVIKHRGPDSEGMYVEQESSVALGHQRLAILDLSPSGHQPMTSRCGNYVIVFNGEVYNFRQLRQELIDQGAGLKSQSDTEVILELYAKVGDQCLDRLDGMFAFAIWDRAKQELFCARDPLGIKPFYYWRTGNCMAFSSEVRSLLQADLEPRRLDAKALQLYLLYGSVQEPGTLVKGIKSLPAGHWMRWNNGHVMQQQYWALNFDRFVETRNSKSYQESLSTVRAALDDSIQRHFVSDVPVGIFLSGGIDSTAILALASQHKIPDIHTLSIGFEDPEFDESELATQTAKHFGTNHQQWIIDAAAGRQLFTDFINSFDMPSNDGFNTYCISRFAHDNQLKVVLSGLGGDELFGGYPSFSRVPALIRLAQRLSCLRGLFTSAIRLPGSSRVPARYRRLLRFLSSQGDVHSAYWAVRGYFSAEECKVLLSRYGVQADGAETEAQERLPTSISDQVAYLESTRYMRNQLLRDSDVLSMSVGLELRTPLVDRKLWDVVTGDLASRRLQPGKKLLTDAVPEIPAWILNQPKKGFRFPLSKWMEGQWADIFATVIKQSPVQLDTWAKKWTLFVLEHFLNTHKIS